MDDDCPCTHADPMGIFECRQCRLGIGHAGDHRDALWNYWNDRPEPQPMHDGREES